MTREEIVEGLKLLEDNMVYFDEVQNDKGEWIDVHELLFETISALSQEPCDDAVSRQAVLKIIDGWYEQNRDTENIEDLIVLITYMDFVRPQEQTGHWIRQDNTKEPLYGWYFCSECNSVIGDKTKFCSNCGARMVEPQERSKE